MGCLTNNLEIYPPRKAEKEKTVARWVVSCDRCFILSREKLIIKKQRG